MATVYMMTCQLLGRGILKKIYGHTCISFNVLLKNLMYL